jgi:hypothetical protein
MDVEKNGHWPSPVGLDLAWHVTPAIFKSLQYVENTPDVTSGAYYAYNLYNNLIIFRFGHSNVLVSISRQTDVSSVGKKGYILGSDDDWDYYYTGEKGLTLPALGWVPSYIFVPVLLQFITKWMRISQEFAVGYLSGSEQAGQVSIWLKKSTSMTDLNGLRNHLRKLWSILCFRRRKRLLLILAASETTPKTI